MAKKGAGRTGSPRPLGSNPPSGKSNADQHFHELVGSNGFWIYLTPNKRLTGYDGLRERVEAAGCTIGLGADAPVDLGAHYPALKIGAGAAPVIPDDILRLAHRWAHSHDFLHSFFKPAFPGF